MAWHSLATLGALSLLPIAIYGPPIYSEWFHALSHDNHFVFVTDIALPALGERFGHPLGGWSLAAIVGAACIFAAARRHAVHIHMISIVSACLCAPLAWTHYLLVAYPWLVERPWNALEPVPVSGLVVATGCIEGGQGKETPANGRSMEVMRANL